MKALRWGSRLLIAFLLLVLLYQLWIFAHIWWWREHNPATTRFMRLQLKALKQQDPAARLQQQWVPYESISVHLKRAVVAAEDDRFLDHSGFDWRGIQHAIERNQEKGRAVAGGSTISQQLAKNLFLSPSRSYVRKAEEAAITMMLEAMWSKKRILEVYLNVAEWGESIFGCEAAARHYFGLSADRLGPAEAVRLAVILPNPRRYGANFSSARQRHAQNVLARMRNTRVP